MANLLKCCAIHWSTGRDNDGNTHEEEHRTSVFLNTDHIIYIRPHPDIDNVYTILTTLDTNSGGSQYLIESLQEQWKGAIL